MELVFTVAEVLASWRALAVADAALARCFNAFRFLVLFRVKDLPAAHAAICRAAAASCRFVIFIFSVSLHARVQSELI